MPFFISLAAFSGGIVLKELLFELPQDMNRDKSKNRKAVRADLRKFSPPEAVWEIISEKWREKLSPPKDDLF